MRKLISVLFLSCLFTFHLSAAQTNTSPGEIKTVTLGGTGHIFVQIDSPTLTNPKGCVNSSYVIPKEHPAYSEYYILLLSAMDAGHNVVLRIDNESCVLGDPDVATSGYPNVQLVQRRNY